jgi:tetratricopeptide (TPR) repeat protein
MPSGDAPRPLRVAELPAAPESEPEEDASPRKVWLAPAVRMVWPVLCLFQLGLLVGGYLAWKRAVPEKEPTQEALEVLPYTGRSLPSEATPEAPSASPPPIGGISRADDLLRLGRYELALALYQPLNDGAAASLRDAVQYRVALCLEGLGRWDQAIAAYRALASRSPAPALAAAAQLGQARVWIRMRRPVEAKPLLGDLIMRSAQPVLRNQAYLADARYLLGLALTVEALRPVKPTPLVDGVAAHTATDWPVERALDWVTAIKDTEGANLEPGEDYVVVQRFGANPEGFLVRASVKHATVSAILESLAEQCGLKVQWTPQAQQQVAERSTAVLVESLPLYDILRALADPLGLMWHVEDGVLNLTSVEEGLKEAHPSYRIALAKRALRDAVLAYPAHPLTPAAYLELGNLEVASSRLKEARAWYERLIKESPRSPMLTEAYYNLGLTQRRLGDSTGARNALYRVVDRAPGHELAPLAYLRIGQLYLEESEPELAIVPLRRAISSSVGSPTQPAATVALGVAYLLTENPRAANAILLENRLVIGQPPYRAVAAFLDALARYRGTVAARQVQREASGLLAALLAVREDPLLGPAGKLLVGQAYRDLGMGEQMVAFYENALRELRGPLAAEMTFILAEALYTADRREAALQLFASLASKETTKWVPRALLRLAEITLQEKRPQDCLTWCRKLLQQPGAADATLILKLMGKAYEQLGDHRRAARCYMGQLPDS